MTKAWKSCISSCKVRVHHELRDIGGLKGCDSGDKLTCCIHSKEMALRVRQHHKLVVIMMIFIPTVPFFNAVKRNLQLIP